ASVELCKRADDVLRDHCVGVWWERDTAQIILVSALCHLGDFDTLHRLSPPMLANAQQRGDQYALTTALGSYIRPLLRLADDKPEEAESELVDLLGQWSQAGFHLQHANGMYRQVEIQLYVGKVNAAHELASRLWTAFSGSLLIRLKYLRVIIRHLCARAALAAATSANPHAHLKCAGRHAKALHGERTLRSRAFARLIEAGIAIARRDRRLAATLLTLAAQDCDALDMRLYAAAVRRQLGELIDADEGRKMTAEAHAWMTSQMIKDPARMTAMLAP